MKLSPRLQCVAGQVQNGAIVADIGTDHAYIPIYLIEEGISPFVYACDIGEGPLNIAQGQIEKANLNDKIVTLLGSGLSPIENFPTDNIIIGGMGGLLIQKIIEGHRDIALSVHRLILQPMIAQEELRRYLINNGFKIITEELAMEERRIYQIIVAQKGEMKIDKDIYYQIPYHLIENKHPLLNSLISFYKNKYHKIIQQCKTNTTINSKKQIELCEINLNELKEVENAIKMSTSNRTN